eukprot:5355216-Pleurochrysis_carterae.AAC.2
MESSSAVTGASDSASESRALSVPARGRTSSTGYAALRRCLTRWELCLRLSRTMRLPIQRALASGRPLRRVVARSALGHCSGARRLEADARLGRNERMDLGKGPQGRSPVLSCERRWRMSRARLR